MNLQNINLFEYSDFRKFLGNYQAHRQELDKTFTRSRFCRELGLPNTRSYFNDIVKGTRNISSNYVERFVKTLELTKEEAEYFRILVFFDQSTYEQELEALLGKELSIKRWRKTAIYDMLEKRLCVDSHKRFIGKKRLAD